MNCDNCGLEIDDRWYEDSCPFCLYSLKKEVDSDSKSNQFETLVLGKLEALEYVPKCKMSSLLISIIDPNRDDLEDQLSSRYRDMLTLKFSDSNCPDFDETIFNLSHANEIVDFLNKHDKSFDFLVVHCTAGISRSAAVASGILFWFGMDNSKYKKSKDYKPNYYIYNFMVRYLYEIERENKHLRIYDLKGGK